MSQDRRRAPWEESFPTRIADAEAVTRRDVARFGLLAGVAVAAGVGWVEARQGGAEGHRPAEVDLGPQEALAPGSWRVFDFAGEPALVVRRRDGTHVAYAQKCTHLACPVTYRPGGGDAPEGLFCPCHHGRFDLDTGRGSGGPPRTLRPLRRIELDLRAGRLVATRFLPRG